MEQKEKMEIKAKEGMVQRLKKSVFAGLLASVLITVSMLAGLSSSNFRRVGIVFLGAISMIFLLKIIYDIVIESFVIKKPVEEKGGRKKFLADSLFLLFAVVAFIAISVASVASAILFVAVHDQKAEKALHQYEDGLLEELSVETESGIMKGWFLHNAPDKSPVVLYFGGNAEDAAFRMNHLLKNSEELSVFDGCNVVCVDYPGYGNSEGTASEKSVKQLGLAAYDSLTGRNDVSGVIVMGYSVGTGVANYVASQRQPLGLILMAPYADGYDLYNSYLDIFHGPLKLLVAFKMKSAKFAQDVSVKPLILASNADETVPYESSKELFEKYKKGCNFVTLENVGHNNFWSAQEVLAEISRYIASVK